MLKETTTDKYVKAFITVAEMLVPDVEFTNVLVDIKTDSNGNVSKDVTVSASLDEEVMVIVTTEQHKTKGLQVVVKHYYMDTMNLIKKRSYWYFSFNWGGLITIQ